jgi:hypothetical protein
MRENNLFFAYVRRIYVVDCSGCLAPASKWSSQNLQVEEDLRITFLMQSKTSCSLSGRTFPYKVGEI